MDLDRLFSTFASRTARVAGSPPAFVLCLLVVLAWAAARPAFGHSQTWQLVINTGTTIVTFMMVFLIQNTQNRDGLALQTELDELILTSAAENEFIGIERSPTGSWRPSMPAAPWRRWRIDSWPCAPRMISRPAARAWPRRPPSSGRRRPSPRLAPGQSQALRMAFDDPIRRRR